MEERVNDEAPQEIKDLLMFPYRFFSPRMAGKTVLDIASGFATQLPVMQEYAANVRCMDVVKLHDFVEIGNLLDTGVADNEVDIVISCETIEHVNAVEQVAALRELSRVAKETLIIGSLDRMGPSHIDDVVIFKKETGRNDFHIRELDCIEFPTLLEQVFPDKKIEYYQTTQDMQGNLQMRAGMAFRPVSWHNYGVITL